MGEIEGGEGMIFFFFVEKQYLGGEGGRSGGSSAWVVGYGCGFEVGGG